MFEIGAQRKGESVLRVLRAASEKWCVLLKYCYNWTPAYSEIVGNLAFVNQVYTHSVKPPLKVHRAATELPECCRIS